MQGYEPLFDDESTGIQSLYQASSIVKAAPKAAADSASRIGSAQKPEGKSAFFSDNEEEVAKEELAAQEEEEANQNNNQEQVSRFESQAAKEFSNTANKMYDIQKKYSSLGNELIKMRAGVESIDRTTEFGNRIYAQRMQEIASMEDALDKRRKVDETEIGGNAYPIANPEHRMVINSLIDKKLPTPDAYFYGAQHIHATEAIANASILTGKRKSELLDELQSRGILEQTQYGTLKYGVNEDNFVRSLEAISGVPAKGKLPGASGSSAGSGKSTASQAMQLHNERKKLADAIKDERDPILRNKLEEELNAIKTPRSSPGVALDKMIRGRVVSEIKGDGTLPYGLSGLARIGSDGYKADTLDGNNFEENNAIAVGKNGYAGAINIAGLRLKEDKRGNLVPTEDETGDVYVGRKAIDALVEKGWDFRTGQEGIMSHIVNKGGDYLNDAAGYILGSKSTIDILTKDRGRRAYVIPPSGADNKLKAYINEHVGDKLMSFDRYVDAAIKEKKKAEEDKEKGNAWAGWGVD